MPPRKLMFIRHGEKPNDNGQPPLGIDINGEPDTESLIPLGWQRAGALAVLFDPLGGKLQNPALAIPQQTAASKIAHGSHSQRPQETISPLNAKLGLTPNTDFAKGDEKKLAKWLLVQSGVVLVCWEHEDIPAIVANLPMAKGQQAPTAWPGDRFDVVWVFDLDATGDGYSFQQIPQCLLAGDADN